MTDQGREQRTYLPRSAYMHYIHTTEMARRHERQRQMSQLDDEIRRDEALIMKRMHDSRMKTKKAIREIRLEQERRLIKEEQKRQEHEERKRIRRQNREQLERELARIKRELRAELAKEDVKCKKAEKEREQHKEEEQKRLIIMQEREECYKQIASSESAVVIKAKEQMQNNEDKQSTATGQDYERIQDETEEEERKDTERENENKTCMVNDERSEEKRETEVQTGYRKKIHEDSLINDDTPQKDCTCISMPYDPLNISCAQITTLEMLQNFDRQETPVDEAHGVCIAQESLFDGPIQCGSAHASLSDEPLQVFETKNINLEVHHVTDLQEKVMQRSLQKYIAQECASEVPQSIIQLGILNVDSEVMEITMYAESRDNVMICKNSCLCFKFLWWQEGTLSS